MTGVVNNDSENWSISKTASFNLLHYLLFEHALTITALCRTIAREHIPKRHLDFENPIKGKNFDNTNIRIYGEPKPEIMTTNNTEYGVARN